MQLYVLNALIANGVALGPAISATFGVVGSVAFRLLAGLALNALASALQRRPQSDLKRDLSFPQSLPPWRFVYGNDRATGTPLPYPVVGEYAYACWLVNSRVSDGNFTLFLDNREVALSGDPFDLTGPGASATAHPFVGHATFWIATGGQTAVPTVFTNEAGASAIPDDTLHWKASDAGSGMTLVFAKLKNGDVNERQERWPSVIPKLTVDGQWSRVWDMRDDAQDPNDPATWTYSDNLFLCALDALRQNPFRPYPLTHIDLAMWRAAADAADELVALKDGGKEKRYRIAGTVAFEGSELEDIVGPMLAAAAASLTRAGGRVGVTPGVWRAPAATISDSYEAVQWSTARPPAEMATELRVTYSPEKRQHEPAELPPWPIPGAAAAGIPPSVRRVDITMCPSDGQAQRVRQIIGRRMLLQKRATVMGGGEAMALLTGSTATLALPEPYGTYVNGDFEVTGMHPFLDPVGTQGLALRCPMTLQETNQTVFDWNPQTDEVTVEHPVYDGARKPWYTGMPAPSLTATAGAAGEIDVVVTQSTGVDATSVQIWGNTIDDAGSATLLTTLAAGPGQIVNYTETGLTAGTTRFYFARAVGLGSFSNFSASDSATAT